ncbi:G2/mitotic-specific cyclin-B3 [Nylanderia fulva]|uniref:G2/mitotic-specific cyclin-B3 n=1 Tax=Nylanderia fulva TaxID=613905 RepID=UPI0010FB115C|nr:G2/mitotic-specific cyclin-B3 [Nylanderia fulva]XP_029164614.1 G2/mitotic-specific cyclin-B3 [Nylanderia fulva]XP_029164615.1 G2/mitotic-specific cyclin-B3 [Nylanderia fulva]XP_029164616.1 G2/mitotic-specific cyclin-B3 [Nylanderia fulva]XP_029164617.1 G2/mitotic-specific cyclin-B3 [Nylanderia fulva]
MAPPKVLLGQNRQNSTISLRKGMTTRSQNAILNNVLKPSLGRDIRVKRKAEASPPKEKTVKRSAFTNITNAITTSLGGQHHASKKPVTHVKPVVMDKPADINIAKVLPVKSKPLPRIKPIIKKDDKTEIPNKVANIRLSADLEKSEDNSLYVSALEDVTDSLKKTRRSNNKVDENEKKIETDAKSEPTSSVSKKKELTAAQLITIPESKLPKDVQWDFDIENWLDPFQVSHYAMDIFQYLKERERLFCIANYMERQVCLSRWMRALLIDWMVEVQESFELNHETLYLAVKLVDLYLTKVTVGKETLQLLGAASLFISSKFDERIPPMVEDFLYICDGAYTQMDLIRMEMNVLKVVNFDLGIPLSYRFLRRYARCAKVSMPTLTLARFILEYSLMDYSMITFSDSKMAAAALLLALLMKDLGGWTATLEYYSGYKLDDIRDICNLLNQCLHKKHKESLMTVRNKYSHKIFFEVAKLPLKETLDI